MEFHPIERSPTAFQQPVTGAQIEVLCRQSFGDDVRVVAAVELGLGMYNNTYRIELDGAGPATGTAVGPDGRVSAVLRVAPPTHRQFRIEKALMRNEHASVPFLAPIAALIPRTLAVDFTHTVIDRDYLIQTLLPGVPAPLGLADYPREQWAEFYRELGAITARIHSVRGSAFGPVNDPGLPTWSAAVLASIQDAQADLAEAGLDHGDVDSLAAAVGRQHRALDEIAEPRMLHGDLWTVNVLIEPGAATPTVTGVCDSDRTSWGDPMADWPIFNAIQRPGTEADGFWSSYPRPPETSGSRIRSIIYRARHIVFNRLEHHRLGRHERLLQSYPDLADCLDQLHRLTP